MTTPKEQREWQERYDELTGRVKTFSEVAELDLAPKSTWCVEAERARWDLEYHRLLGPEGNYPRASREMRRRGSKRP